MEIPNWTRSRFSVEKKNKERDSSVSSEYIPCRKGRVLARATIVVPLSCPIHWQCYSSRGRVHTQTPERASNTQVWFFLFIIFVFNFLRVSLCSLPAAGFLKKLKEIERKVFCAIGEGWNLWIGQISDWNLAVDFASYCLFQSSIVDYISLGLPLLLLK